MIVKGDLIKGQRVSASGVRHVQCGRALSRLRASHHHVTCGRSRSSSLKRTESQTLCVRTVVCSMVRLLFATTIFVKLLPLLPRGHWARWEAPARHRTRNDTRSPCKVRLHTLLEHITSPRGDGGLPARESESAVACSRLARRLSRLSRLASVGFLLSASSQQTRRTTPPHHATHMSLRTRGQMCIDTSTHFRTAWKLVWSTSPGSLDAMRKDGTHGATPRTLLRVLSG